MQKHWNRMQGYSLSVVVQGEATKQAWWIIIQMFSTGTLNGMRSRLASRKILITHLISHRASSAPGGAPACVCVSELERKERAFAVAVFLTMWYTFQWVETQMRKTMREICHSFSSVLSSHPVSLLPLPTFHHISWSRGKVKRVELHVWLSASRSLDTALGLISLV